MDLTPEEYAKEWRKANGRRKPWTEHALNIGGLCLAIAVILALLPYVWSALFVWQPPAPFAVLTPEPAIVATQRPVSVPRPQAQPAQQPIQQPAAPVIPIPTAYTLATAEAISNAEYQQVIQEVEAAIPAPNASKVVEQPEGSSINKDWCTGSHADNPECQPGNGQKVGR